MNLKKDTLFNCLAFYDYDAHKVQLEKLYNYGLSFYKSYNQVPKRMGLDGRHILYSAKTKTFKHYDKKIREEKFVDIDYIWMGGGYPEDHGNDQEDCYIGFNIGISRRKVISLYFYDELVPFNSSHFQNMASEIIQLCSAKYGMVYQKIRDQACYGYCLPIIYSHYNEEERKESSNWNRAYNNPYNDCGTYKTGDLRDIYPMNFTSQEHLDRIIFGKSFKKWVEEDSSRGTITSLKGTSLWVWEVRSENISTLREILKPTDMLVCFRPYR